MKTEQAKTFPLLRDVEFALYVGDYNVKSTVLVPKSGIYVPKHYEYNELLLIPYLQEPFSQNKTTTLRKILQRYKEDHGDDFVDIFMQKLDEDLEEISRVPDNLADAVNRFLRDGLISSSKKIAKRHKGRDYTTKISKSRNYDKTRVFRIWSSGRYLNYVGHDAQAAMHSP